MAVCAGTGSGPPRSIGKRAILATAGRVPLTAPMSIPPPFHCVLRGASVLLLSSLALALGTLAPSHAAVVRTPNVEAELVAERTALVPGQPATVALRLKMREGWHTYWRNPGDSGLPTSLDWKLPDGITAGAIQWPAPHALPAGPLVNYGYEGEVLHLVDLEVPASLAKGGTATLAARADWLVCKETCIPEGADLTLALPVADTAEPDSRWGTPIARTRAALPKPLAGWQADATGLGQKIALKLVPPKDAADPGALYFFPHEEGRVEPSRPQTLARDGNAYVLTLPVAFQLAPNVARLDGVLAASKDLGAPGLRAATLDVALAGSIVAGPKPVDAPPPALNLKAGATSAAGVTLPLAVLLALVGGLVLNLMPCVFPVLSLKVLGFVQHHDSKHTLHKEAIAFTTGVILTFVALGLALSALRAAGEELGWGFQLQSPAVVTGLAVLFFLLALNLSGVFEFGMLAPSRVAGWTAKNRTLDAFASGVLAVVVASPCTAPFMGAALGYALSQSTLVTMAVFVALGVGMAVPYTLLAWFPAWRRHLPKPGMWMERMKQFLAFPLYATVAWLAWVLGAQMDNDAVLRLAVVLVSIAFAAWAWRVFRSGGVRGWAVAAAVGAAGAAVLALPLLNLGASMGEVRTSEAAAKEDWEPYSPARVAELGASGRPVFVDFTAAWCVTCQVNKKLVLNQPAVRDAFGKRNVALLRADWTRRDPVITQTLAALGRNGVPVYVLYRPGKDPLLLPEVLQAQLVYDALATL